MSRQVQYTFIVEVDGNHKSAVSAVFPNLDDVFKMPGVNHVSMTVTVESIPPDQATIRLSSHE